MTQWGATAPNFKWRSDWRPTASMETLRLRARILEHIRAFFTARGVLEVDTHCLSSAAVTDLNIESFRTQYVGPGASEGASLYLHTSPEFAMKRLLAAGSGPIYQICKVFRQGEAGSQHNPEFTLLEWYRLGFDCIMLRQEVADLVTALLSPYLDLQPIQHMSYQEAFERYAGVDAHRSSSRQLMECMDAFGIAPVQGQAPDDRDGLLDIIVTHIVIPRLRRNRPVFIYDFPASQAALARIRQGSPPVAERFELYINGIELANGCQELTDSGEQRRRFRFDLARHHGGGDSEVPIDEYLLGALDCGLPDCSGVALGMERLCMIAIAADSIEQVMAFPLTRV